jgi:hypothetical protein
MQIEKSTFLWLQSNYKYYWPELRWWNFEQLIEDDRASILIARLKYLSIPKALPKIGDLPGQAAYWNRYYNCNPNHGTDVEYIAAYKKYVLKGGAV